MEHTLQAKEFNPADRWTQHATRAIFFVGGFGAASWAPLVPLLRERLAIGEDILGLLLLCIGIGSLLTMPLSGGGGSKAGVQAVIVEKASGKRLMSGMHALWSVSGFAGAENGAESDCFRWQYSGLYGVLGGDFCAGDLAVIYRLFCHWCGQCQCGAGVLLAIGQAEGYADRIGGSGSEYFRVFRYTDGACGNRSVGTCHQFVCRFWAARRTRSVAVRHCPTCI